VKPFKFRCVKITVEEKRSVRLVNGDQQHGSETTVAVQFEQADNLGSSPSMHGFAYASINLTNEQFKEYNYQVGQEYVLCAFVDIDSIVTDE
jgi:hypothetical protein